MNLSGQLRNSLRQLVEVAITWPSDFGMAGRQGSLPPVSLRASEWSYMKAITLVTSEDTKALLRAMSPGT